MRFPRLSEKEKLVYSLAAIAGAGAIWLILSMIGVEMSFLAFAVLTLALYFAILAGWRRGG